MKIVFFGSSHFAVPALEALIKSRQEVCAVVTQPDRKKGRHLRLGQTDVKAVAKAAGLDIFQPENINSPASLKYLKARGADIFVVVAYGQILSQEVLDIPRIFSLNIHASLLPKYRGAAPVNWAVISGERSTGVTIIRLIRKMDAGPVLLQRAIPVTEEDDAVTMEEKLRVFGAELLLEALQEVEGKTYRLMEQDETLVVAAPKLKKDCGLIDWEKPASRIHDAIRGCLPWPGAFTYYKGKRLKIYKAEVTQEAIFPAGLKCGGVLVDKREMVVKAGKGGLVIRELQLEAGKRMSAGDFIHGHKIKTGEAFSRQK